MKMIAMLSLMLLSAPTFATSIRSQHIEELPVVIVNGKQESRLTAVANVQYIRNEILVEIFDNPCGYSGNGQVRCLAMPRLIQTLRVPIQSREQSCGSVYISGIEDETPVDGRRTEITFIDHSQRKCRDVQTSRIVVEASTFNPWTSQTVTYELRKRNIRD